jgi:hypothetical protein
MKGGGKIEPPKATAALLSRLGWEDREIHAEIERGSPHVIPLSLDGSPRPLHLADRTALPFVEVGTAMPRLWQALGLPDRAVWTLPELGRMIRIGARLVDAVKWCGQADSFLSAREDTLETLEDCEAYLANIGAISRWDDDIRFARHVVSYSSEEAQAEFDDEFYTYETSYLGGTVVVERFRTLASELVSSTRADAVASGTEQPAQPAQAPAGAARRT